MILRHFILLTLALLPDLTNGWLAADEPLAGTRKTKTKSESFSDEVSDEVSDKISDKMSDKINDEFKESIAPFLKSFCIDCHGSETMEADFSLHQLTGDFASESQSWEKVHEMLSLEQMPPEDAPSPKKERVQKVIQWITGELRKVGREPDPSRLQLPRFGNRVNHEDLFSGKYSGPAYSYSRLWRISPEIYAQMAKENGITRHHSQGLADSMADALAPLDGMGLQDYALLRADEATLRTLVTSSRMIAKRMTVGRVIQPRRKGNKPSKSRIDKNSRIFRKLKFLDAESATDEELAEGLNQAFAQLLRRQPTDEERESYGTFLRNSVQTGGPMAGFQNLITAMLMSPEFIFRMELGLGKKLPDGRRFLAPQEIAFALSYAIDDRPPDAKLLEAVEKGRLATREDVAREARRLLTRFDDVHTYFTVPMQALGTKTDPYNTRPLRFFREFFGYHRATSVFKDDEHSRGRTHDAKKLVDDADRFVLEILDRDQNVFHNLLTSDQYFAAYVPPRFIEREFKRMLSKKGKKANPEIQEMIDRGHNPIPQRFRGYIQAFNLDRSWSWKTEQPFKLENRSGMLTHPAWLVAHSGNFDNDPIRRGKWIRERLLAGNVPDLPIGVEAKLPEDPHQTLRERMHVTREATCWRCHKQMNPLGLPFEEYDDFGSHRTKIVLQKEQRKRDKVVVAEKSKPVDAKGKLTGTGNESLDGDVSGALDLIERLARSDRVRQSMIRHVFRYWMGRNETLDDSPTLIAMDNAYLKSGGSFNELLITLLTSDSFLLRRDMGSESSKNDGTSSSLEKPSQKHGGGNE